MNSNDSDPRKEQETSATGEHRETYSSEEHKSNTSSGYWQRNPLVYLRRFADEAERLFEDVAGKQKWFDKGWQNAEDVWAPNVEVYRQNNDVIVSADVPGIRKEDIHIEFTEEGLTIRGTRQHEQETVQDGSRRSERSFGQFFRRIPVNEKIDSDRIVATLQDGVLRVALPILEKSNEQSKTISIK